MTSLPIRAGCATAVAAAIVAIAGCGSGDSDTATAKATSSPAETATAAETATPAAQAAPAAAPVPAALRGRWRRTMRARDWKVAGGGLPRGTWRVAIGRRGTMAVYTPRTTSVDFRTELAAEGKKATIGSVPICPTTTGRYRWKASGRRLTLATVKDPCAPRDALFGGTWTRAR